jgi:hypothetical protein
MHGERFRHHETLFYPLFLAFCLFGRFVASLSVNHLVKHAILLTAYRQNICDLNDEKLTKFEFQMNVESDYADFYVIFSLLFSLSSGCYLEVTMEINLIDKLCIYCLFDIGREYGVIRCFESL